MSQQVVDRKQIAIRSSSCILTGNDYIRCEDFFITNDNANGYKNINEDQSQHAPKSQLQDILEHIPIDSRSFHKNNDDNNNSSIITCHSDDISRYNKYNSGSESIVSNSAPIISETTPTFKRVCVFCGSRSGNKSIYSEASLELAKELVKRNMGLVYGGGNVGLMGLISRVVHQGGCHVIGVIPKAMTPREICGDMVAWGDVHVVDNMHERKAEMAQLADAFIALPGGYGTLEELMEIITSSQLGINNKPVGLLNVNGYYNSLLNLFDKFVDEGFINSNARNIVVSATSGKELLLKMEEYTPFYNSCGQHIS